VKTSSTFRSALVAIGGSLAAVPASALELGDVQVHSSLGQPLRASIAYALGPNEALANNCVTVQPANSVSGMPSTDRGSLVVAPGRIEYTSNSVVREPLLSIQVAVNCHYTARLARDYMLFIDPVNATPVAAPTPEPVAARPQVSTPPARPAPAALPPRTIEHAPVAATTVSTVAESNAADPVVPLQEGSVYEPAEIPEIPAEPPVEVPVLTTSTSSIDELQPGDVFIGADNPFVQPIDTTNSEPVTNTEPVVVAEPTSIIRQPETTPGSSWTSNWLTWLGAGGGAVAVALVLFGRRLRERFGSSPIAPARPRREPMASEPERVEAVVDIDVIIDDDSPTAENLALDADLVMGTGLQEGAEVEVAQDFDFASTTDLDLDLELPEEAAADEETPETDILPPLHADDQDIVDSEVLPDDDEYDFSVMIDATKMPDPNDVTERDLEAIEVNDGDEALIDNDYTVSNEVDYTVLEQDYEDEITATQALSEEIRRAAEDTGINDELDITVEVAANDLPKSDKKAG
jgi:hypothetical protein